LWHFGARSAERTLGRKVLAGFARRFAAWAGWLALAPSSKMRVFGRNCDGLR
jgi:hypothetical protein